MFLKRVSFLLFLSALSYSYGQDWHYDLTSAKEIAKEKNKDILLVFTGSDWCPPCIRLEKNILSSEEFINYSLQNLVLVRVDFPKKKKNALTEQQKAKNDKLAQQYNKRRRFPMLVVLGPNGDFKGKKTGYPKKRVAEDYISFINSLKI